MLRLLMRILMGLLLLVGAGVLVASAGVVAASVVALLIAVAVTLGFFALAGLPLYWLIARRLRLRRPRIRMARRLRRARILEELRAWRDRREPAMPPPQAPDSAAREARRLAREISQLVRGSDRATREALSGAPRSAQRLSEHVGALAKLAHELEAHLEGTGHEGIERRAADMEVRAARATDPITQEQYRAAARSLDQQAQVCRELASTRERTHAEIARILSALAALRSRIMAARTGLRAQPGDVDRAADELADLQQQVDVFQDSVRQVVRQAGQPAG